MVEVGKSRALTVSAVVVAVVAAAAALFLGREFFQPVAIAVLLALVFRPVVRALERLRLPTPIAAGIVVLGLIGALVAAGYALADPVENWFRSAPQTFEAAQGKLERIRRPIRKATQLATQIEQAAAPAPSPATAPSGAAAAAAARPAEENASVTATPASAGAPAAEAPRLLVRVFGTTTALASGAIEILLLLLLLLASGDLFARKAQELASRRGRDPEAVRATVRDVRQAVIRYVVATAAINASQAAVVMLALRLLGVPHVLLWGVFTFVLEFIPYLGATIMVALLAVAGFTQFDSLGHILAVPASYLLITTIQNNVVSPYAYGRHLRLSPVAVLLGVLLWWFLWGTPGAFVAVPILAAARIVAERTKGLEAVAVWLGE